MNGKIGNASGTAAYLFPGQGTRYKGAALDFLASGGAEMKRLFELASDIFGRNMESVLRDIDEQTMKRTDVAQMSLTLCGLAATAFLGERGWKPGACAGFSLGEYPAMVCAGVVSAEDGLRLIKARGAAMQKSADKLRDEAGGDSSSAPGMTAVIGLAPEKAEELIEKWRAQGLSDLYPANFNSPVQLVVSGTGAALNEAEARFAEIGVKSMRLRVAGPFHSPLMSDAAEAFAPALEAARFADPKIPLYSNVTGKRVESGAEAKRLALLQVTAPVRWVNEQAAIGSAGGFDFCLEVGPGKVLRGFWKDTVVGIPCYGAGTVEEVEKIGEN
jgi:[acyl-carrier-protein] S-malonyltransferase